MTREETKTVINAATVLWPHSPVVPTGLEVLAVDLWWQLLGDLDQSAVLAALQTFATEGAQHSPPGGTFRARTVQMLTELDGTRPPLFGDAWHEVTGQIVRVGRTGDPVWSHPAIAETVASIGWTNLCNANNVDVSLAHFRRIYEAYAARQVVQASLAPGVRSTLQALAGRLTLGRGDDDGTAD